jgi:hypothetical protein
MEKLKHSALFSPEFKRQLDWREDNISTKEFGYKYINKQTSEPERFPHIVPFENWEETLFDGIRKELPDYINRPGKEIKAHDDVNNLLSSWVLCANLYFPARINPDFRALLCEFLKLRVSDKISTIENIELEFAFPEDDLLHPNPLLGETTGSRGTKQTSPDVAFLVKTIDGNDGIILTESKFTEHHFYGCSTNPETAKYKNKNLNPNFSRCMQPAKEYNYKAICHQTNAWHRNYMNLLRFSDQAEIVLNNCPAATDGYQLFRQQALAEGIAQSGRFELVVSAVAYDERNNDLICCLKSTGIDDFTDGWETLFTGKALFKSWTHQKWVDFVRKNQINGEFTDWVKYMEERYGY